MATSELMYFAGLFDGEGCVHVGIQKAGYISVTVRIVMLRREPIDICVGLFGGKVGVYHRKGRDEFHWHIENGNAVGVLEAISKYCIIKNEVAKLAYPIAQSMRNNKAGPGLPLSERQDRLDAVNAIRSLIGKSEVQAIRQEAYLKPRTHGAKTVRRSDGKTYETQGLAAIDVGRTQTAISFAIKNGTKCSGYNWEFVQ